MKRSVMLRLCWGIICKGVKGVNPNLGFAWGSALRKVSTDHLLERLLQFISQPLMWVTQPYDRPTLNMWLLELYCSSEELFFFQSKQKNRGPLKRAVNQHDWYSRLVSCVEIMIFFIRLDCTWFSESFLVVVVVVAVTYTGIWRLWNGLLPPTFNRVLCFVLLIPLLSPDPFVFWFEDEMLAAWGNGGLAASRSREPLLILFHFSVKCWGTTVKTVDQGLSVTLMQPN